MIRGGREGEEEEGNGEDSWRSLPAPTPAFQPCRHHPGIQLPQLENFVIERGTTSEGGKLGVEESEAEVKKETWVFKFPPLFDVIAAEQKG